MPVIRKIYSTGGATVVALSKIQSEMTGLVVGSEAVVDLCTPRRLLRAMGVAEGVIGSMDLGEVHFLTVRLYVPGVEETGGSV